MSETAAKARVAFAATGVANLASIMAAFRRAGADPYLAADADDLAAAAFAVVPGVGSFGSAMEALRKSGMEAAVKDRVLREAPTMGVCAGMQLFFEASEESPGVVGMCIEKGELKRFPSSLPVPQLGWNRVRGTSRPGETGRGAAALVKDGWAYFANSYRLTSLPPDLEGSWADYGDSFVAAAEKPGLLLCQFHPELSGPWGQDLITRWLKQDGGAA
jgi:imidazole glycerol phosphate synthase, glutamine amidotransferase subunit